MSSSCDRSVVLGLMALRLEFISERDFLAGLKHRQQNDLPSLGDVLIEQGLLSPRQVELLNPLVDEHLSRFGNEPLRSLEALHGTSLIEIAAKAPDTSRFGSTSPFTPPGDNRGYPSTGSIVDTDAPEANAESSFGTSLPRGRYRIIEFYKRGGLGEVYRASDDQLGRTVALKQINQKYAHADDMRRRFMREAEINGRLEHPSIVPVYSLGSYDDGRPFYTMRFVAGEELSAAVKRFHSPPFQSPQLNRGQEPIRNKQQKSLDFRLLLRRFLDVCNAIAYAHSKGVVHRDLKPANVLVGSFGETFLIDWGLAKVTQETDAVTVAPQDDGPLSMYTQLGAKVGTPSYMSPEQARGDIAAIGQASDIFGLGAILYEILTGHAPLQGPNEEEIYNRAIQAQVPPPRSATFAIPQPLAAICLKALSFSPTDRYESAAHLAADVENWLADEPVAAHHDSTLEKLGRVARHNRTAVVGTGVLLVAATIALGVISGLTSRQNQALLAANSEIKANFERAEAENQRAEKNLDQWREVAFELRQIAEGVMARTPGAESQRQHMTDLLVQTMTNMFDQRSNDRALRRDLAQAHRIHANLQRLTNKNDVALTSYRQALAHLDELVQTDRQDKKSQDRLAETLRDQSNSLEATGDLNGAVAALTRASEIVATLLRQEPNSTNYARTNATILLDRAEPLVDLGRNDEALESAAKAASELRRLADSSARQPTDVALLLLAQNQQAEILRQMDREEESAKVLIVAIAEARKAAEGGENDARHTLARTLLNQGQLLLTRNSAQAEATLQEALAIWVDLSRKFPQRAFYQRYRAQTLVAQGKLRAQVGQLAEASNLMKSAFDLLSPIVTAQPTSIPFRSALAETCVEMARVLKAAGSRDEARQQLQQARDELRHIVQQKPASVVSAARLRAAESDLQKLPSSDN